MRNLDEIRTEITKIDGELLELFSKRFQLVREVGEYKKANDLPIRDEKREQDLLSHLRMKAKSLLLSDSFISSTWQNIFNESYKLEK